MSENELPSVTASEGTMGGQLVFAGTRVALTSVWAFVTAGSTGAEIAEAYPDLTGIM